MCSVKKSKAQLLGAVSCTVDLVVVLLMGAVETEQVRTEDAVTVLSVRVRAHHTPTEKKAIILL